MTRPFTGPMGGAIPHAATLPAALVSGALTSTATGYAVSRTMDGERSTLDRLLSAGAGVAVVGGAVAAAMLIGTAGTQAGSLSRGLVDGITGGALVGSIVGAAGTAMVLYSRGGDGPELSPGSPGNPLPRPA